jgi:hypothetical protein
MTSWRQKGEAPRQRGEKGQQCEIVMMLQCFVKSISLRYSCSLPFSLQICIDGSQGERDDSLGLSQAQSGQPCDSSNGFQSMAIQRTFPLLPKPKCLTLKPNCGDLSLRLNDDQYHSHGLGFLYVTNKI